jgi:hypothetical protein
MRGVWLGQRGRDDTGACGHVSDCSTPPLGQRLDGSSLGRVKRQWVQEAIEEAHEGVGSVSRSVSESSGCH